jgi:hypothetical protein
MYQPTHFNLADGLTYLTDGDPDDFFVEESCQKEFPLGYIYVIRGGQLISLQVKSK